MKQPCFVKGDGAFCVQFYVWGKWWLYIIIPRPMYRDSAKSIKCLYPILGRIHPFLRGMAHFVFNFMFWEMLVVLFFLNT